MSDHDEKNVHGEHETAGDKIHRITAYLEHLMDIFEIGIAIIVAFGFIVSVYPLVRELPLLGSMSQGTVSYRHFLESALDLVIGIEFIKMLIKHTPGSVAEVLLFALSRHMVLEGGSSMENLLTVCAIAIIFAIRKFLFVETFEFTTSDKPVDWLSDWKEIKKVGKAEEKKPRSKKSPKDPQPKYTEVEAAKDPQDEKTTT